MAEYCPARYTREDTKIHFVDGKNLSFYLPYRCWAHLEKGEKRCLRCSVKRPTKNQTARTYENGDYNSPIPKGSHIYGGEWYQEQVKRIGEPSKEKLEMVRKALADATAASPPTDGQQTQEKQKKPRKPRVKMPIEESVVSVSAAVSDTAAVSTPGRKKKVVLPPPAPVSLSLPESVEFAESGEPPLHVSNVKVISLRTFVVNDKTYWRDSEKDKIYQFISKEKHGKYLGRWNPQTETIVSDASDSDSD